MAGYSEEDHQPTPKSTMEDENFFKGSHFIQNQVNRQASVQNLAKDAGNVPDSDSKLKNTLDIDSATAEEDCHRFMMDTTDQVVPD